LLDFYSIQMSEEHPAPELPCSPREQDLDWPNMDWPPEEVHELIGATKLCETCCPIFGSDPYEDDGSLLQHHASHETLRRSFKAGCLICTMLYERWERYSASPDRPSLIPRAKSSQGLAFCYTRRDEAVVFGVGPRDLGDSEAPEVDILLYFRMRKRKFPQYLSFRAYSLPGKD
jgi:hypothetical protein